MPFELVWLWAIIPAAAAIVVAQDELRRVRRRALLARWAAARGLGYRARDDAPAGTPFPYFLSGQKRRAINVISGPLAGDRILIFDYRHEEDLGEAMVGRRRGERERTCVVLPSGLAGRQVDIARRRPFDELTGAGSFIDIEPPNPSLALRWRVRASDPRFAAALLDEDVCAFIEAAPDVRFETAGGSLAVIAPRTEAADLEALLELARALRARLPARVRASYGAPAAGA